MPETEKKQNSKTLMVVLICVAALALIALAVVLLLKSDLIGGSSGRDSRQSGAQIKWDDDDWDDDDDDRRSSGSGGDLFAGLFGGSAASSGGAAATVPAEAQTPPTTTGTAGGSTDTYYGVPSASKYDLWSLYATSELYEPEYNVYHSVDRLVDDDLSTAWVEGVDGYGYGEAVHFEFYDVRVMYGLDIWAGYQKSDEAYWSNARPAGIWLTFSDGTELYYWLDDYNDVQTIYFDEPIYAEWMELMIQDVYPGSVYEDTVISEISFF